MPCSSEKNSIYDYVPKTVPLKQYEHDECLLHQLINCILLDVRSNHFNSYFYKERSYLIFITDVFLFLSFYSSWWQNNLYLIVRKNRNLEKKLYGSQLWLSGDYAVNSESKVLIRVVSSLSGVSPQSSSSLRWCLLKEDTQMCLQWRRCFSSPHCCLDPDRFSTFKYTIQD